MPNEVAIRRGTIQDFAAIASMLDELDAHHVRLLPEVFQRVDDSHWQRQRIAGFLDRDDAAIFLAELGQQVPSVAGLATVQITDSAPGPILRSDRRVRIDNLFVFPEFQRLGIGKALLDHVASWAQSRGAGHIEINVWHANTAGLSFFTNQGFTVRNQRMELRLDEAT